MLRMMGGQPEPADVDAGHGHAHGHGHQGMPGMPGPSAETPAE